MKITTRRVLWSAYGLCLCLLLVLYACNSKEAEPIAPYTFKDLKDLQMPPARLAATASVTVTPANFTPSSQAAAVKAGIATVASGGGVTAPVSQAAADMAAILTTAGVNAPALVASFSPQVLVTLTGTGTLPSGLQGTVNTLLADSRLLPYLPTFSYPRVNGTEVGPTTTSVPPPILGVPVIQAVSADLVNYAGSDPCFLAANTLFNQTIANLNTIRLSQLASVTATFTQERAAAEGEVPGCLTNTQTSYSNQIAAAKSALDATVLNLNTAKTTLGDPAYNALLALAYVQYSYEIKVYYNLQAAELNVCSISKDIKLASSRVARDTNTSAINEAFNNTVKTAQAIVLGIYDACHNQGSGG